MTKARTLSEVFTLIITTLQTNTAFKTFCTSKFGAQPDIQAGIDDDDLPSGPDGGTVRIIPGSRSRTRGMSKRSHVIKIVGIIKKTGVTSGTGYKILTAIDWIDQFISKIEEAVIPAVQKDGIAITPIDGEPDDIAHPYARAEIAYLIEIPSEI